MPLKKEPRFITGERFPVISSMSGTDSAGYQAELCDSLAWQVTTAQPVKEEGASWYANHQAGGAAKHDPIMDIASRP